MQADIKRLTITLLTLIFAVSELYSQSARLEVIPSAGTLETNGGISMNWTVGEPVISTMSSQKFFVTSGFNQTYWEVVGEWSSGPLDFDVSLFPNPMSSEISVQFQNSDFNDAGYQIVVYDMLYKPVFIDELTKQKSTFNLSMLRNGTYLFHVMNQEGEFLKTYRVVKNQ